jgi:Family of unknown function (DUF6150)
MARIYQSPSMADADIRVAIVTDRSEADLLVHRVITRALASEEAHWYVTQDRTEAKTLIWVTSAGMAQLRICFVDSADEAGWVRSHPLQGSIR